MAEASTIGANFSSYTGDQALGGSTLGAFKLDTRPLEDFARYTMLYNREEQERKQKEAEKAAEELGKIADYDLTSSIPKDAKVLQEKYDKLINYVKQNPGSLQFKNRDQWIEYQRLKNDLGNDIRGAKMRNMLNMAREEEISITRDEAERKNMREQLNKEIEQKDIRTPLFYTQRYDMTVPDFGLNKGQSLLVNRFLPNQIVQDNYEIFDASEARRKGAAFALGVDFDESTPAGKLKAEKLKSNFYVKGAELLNQAIDNAKSQVDQSLSEADKDAALKAKLSGIGIIKNIDALNKYLADTQARIKAGEYKGNNLNVEDFTPINWKDGLSPDEIAMVAQFSAWEGDSRNSKIVQTNDAIEQARLALGWANLNLDKEKFNALKDKTTTEDWISADAALRQMQDAIKQGSPWQINRPNGGKESVLKISDPFLIKELSGLDKSGNVNNVADVVYFDKNRNQIVLQYYVRNADGEIETTGSKSKGTFGYKLEREEPINASDWFGQIVKRKNPNKDIGGVNAIGEQILNQFNRNLENFAEGYRGVGSTATTTKTTEQSSTNSSSTKKLTPEQEAFIKKYGLKQ